MKRKTRLSGFLAAAAMLCMSSPISAQTQPTTTGAAPVRSVPALAKPTKSLYERLGGVEAITAVVDGFLGRAVKNPIISKRFEGANVVRLREKLIEQIASATGGPQKYTGLDMRTAHAGMNISEREFNALVGDIVATLKAAKVPEPEINELLAILGPTKKDMVAPPKPRGTRDRIRLLEDTVSRLELRVTMLQRQLAVNAAGAATAAVTAATKPAGPMFTDAEKAQVPSLKQRFVDGPALPPPAEGRSFVGKPLTQSRFIGQDGSIVNIADLKDQKKAVVIFMRGFAGAVCINCSSQLLALSENKDKFEKANAQVFIVYPGEANSVPQFLEAVSSLKDGFASPFPILLDVDLAAVRAFDIEGALAKPTTLIIGQDGNVSWAYVGQTPADRPSVATILGEVAKAK